MVSDSLITADMQQAVGQPLSVETFEVERGAITRFARAIGDPNPIFNEEHDAPATGKAPSRDLIAPPTFLRSLTPAIPPLPDGDRVPRAIDGGSAWQYLAPLRPGDRITVTTRLESLTERTGRLGQMLMAVYAIEYRDQRGDQVAVQRNTLIRY